MKNAFFLSYDLSADIIAGDWYDSNYQSLPNSVTCLDPGETYYYIISTTQDVICGSLTSISGADATPSGDEDARCINFSCAAKYLEWRISNITGSVSITVATGTVTGDCSSDDSISDSIGNC